MPKYRHLSKEELKALEKEFINYLIVNGIDADEWSNIQDIDPKKAEEITNLFSDVVFEKIFRQAIYLTHQTKDSLHCFHFQESQAVMFGLKSTTGKIELDSNIITKLKSGKYELITGKKSYDRQREVEIFDLTLKGAEISDGSTYKLLASML